MRRLHDGELDVAIAYDNPSLGLLDSERLDGVMLFEDAYRAVLPERHPLAGSDRPLDLVALRRETWIGGLPGTTWFRIVRDACRAAGFDPQVGFASDDYRGVQAFVAAGLGVAVVPGLAVAAGRVAGTHVRPLLQGPVRHVHAVRQRDAFPTSASLLMVETLAAVTARFRSPAPSRAPR